MANENPNPSDGPIAVDPSQAEALLASNIASDDFLWVVRASVEELHKLFQSPVQWVASLASLPGWVDAVTREPAPAPVLTVDFGMSVAPSDREDPDGWVVVQGIGGTNQLTVLASRASAIRSLLATDKVAEATARTLDRTVEDARRLTDAELLDAGTEPFGPFWELVSRKKTLIVDVILPISRFYAHFEILDPGETPAERAQRTCSFLLGSVFDAEGEARMYNGLDQETLYAEGDRGEKGPRVALSAGSRPKGFYANIEGEEGEAFVRVDGEQDPPKPVCICTGFTGSYRTTREGTIEDGMIKRWGVECHEPTVNV